MGTPVTRVRLPVAIGPGRVAITARILCFRAHPIPPRSVCVAVSEPNRVHQVIFTTQDPPVLGIGFAAFRDVGSFFKYATGDDEGTANPVAEQIDWVVARGASQSGNMLRQFLHLGFNEDEQSRRVHDGAWPQRAGRRLAMNFRFAMPDGVLKLYEPGGEGAQWWGTLAGLRARPANRRRTRPLQSQPDMPEDHREPRLRRAVGTQGRSRVCRHRSEDRCPIASKRAPVLLSERTPWRRRRQHRCRAASAAFLPEHGDTGAACYPIIRCRSGIYATALEVHLRDWVMHDIEPPPSRYPRLHGHNAVLVMPTKEAMGFPDIPGVPESAPTGLMNPIFDYDYGPDFDHFERYGRSNNRAASHQAGTGFSRATRRR